MRTPAPPYVGEGPHALWHVSENPSIERFEPHVSATAKSTEPRVWAVDTRHLPLYWFPRECPRGTFWATPETKANDADLLGDSRRVHIVEAEWLDRLRTTRVYAYRLPEDSFSHDHEVGGYWLSRETVVPAERRARRPGRSPRRCDHRAQAASGSAASTQRTTATRTPFATAACTFSSPLSASQRA